MEFARQPALVLSDEGVARQPTPPYWFYLGLRVFQSVRVPQCGLAQKPRGARVRSGGNRTTLVAVKGKRCTLVSSPSTNQLTEVDRPEHPNILTYGPLPLRSRLAELLPRPLR